MYDDPLKPGRIEQVRHTKSRIAIEVERRFVHFPRKGSGDENFAAGFEDSKNLAQRLLRVRHVLKHFSQKDKVKRGIFKRERAADVCRNKVVKMKIIFFVYWNEYIVRNELFVWRAAASYVGNAREMPPPYRFKNERSL